MVIRPKNKPATAILTDPVARTQVGVQVLELLWPDGADPDRDPPSYGLVRGLEDGVLRVGVWNTMDPSLKGPFIHEVA